MRETERGLRMEAKERQYYVLLSALCTTYTQSIDQQIAKWINPHYLKVLEYIRKHEGVKPSELAEVFRMSKSNVTKIVSYFVHNDFVEREVEQKDRRSLHLKTVAEGVETADQVNWLRKRLMAGESAERRMRSSCILRP